MTGLFIVSRQRGRARIVEPTA